MYTAGIAEAIARGEYEATKALYEMIPRNVPKPVGWGPCAGNSQRAFFIAEFRNMTDEMPGVDELAALTAKIHQKQSPNGKFGFDVMTFSGKHGSDNNWCDTWEEFFTRAMADTMDGERKVHGTNKELDALSPLILSKVIPRLIRPMETEGRSITPILLHGDYWHGNVSVDNETNEAVLYDPCSFYGHYECKCLAALGQPQLNANNFRRLRHVAGQPLSHQQSPRQGILQACGHERTRGRPRRQTRSLCAVRDMLDRSAV